MSEGRLPLPLRELLGPSTPAERRSLGPFHLVRQLGRGGFAPVWLAEERYGGQPLRWAAVKLFALHSGATEVGASILEEARRLCQVEHPNVVRFYALPVDEARGVAGLAMEFVDGPSLDRALIERGRLSVDEAVRAAVAVASALGAVHRAGLVHRDVKPANVIEARGVYKLIDFGIAAAGAAGGGKRVQVVIDDLPLELTGSRVSELPRGTVRVQGEGEAWFAGTVGYIDPCCLRDGAAATAASDLYALGATLFEGLSGKLPAAGEAGLRGPVLSGLAAPPSVGAEVEGLPAALVRLVDALLSPSTAARPASAERVLVELERIQRELRGRAAEPPAEGPFRGLGRFEESDRDVFFGRSTEVAAAVDRLRTRGLVALVGPSGTGKSSLARAGVLPAIEEGALGGWPRRWRSAVATPGSDPRGALGAALGAVVGGLSSLDPERAVGALVERVQRSEEGVVLLVDQLEELATQATQASRRWAAEFLRSAGEQPVPGLRVLATLRQDLLSSLLTPELSLGALREVLLRGAVLVLPLSDAAWEEALDEGLGRYGYAFEDEALRGEVLGQLRGAAGAMPLVQFALSQLWAKRDAERRRIGRQALVELGGIGGALEQHAEGVMEELGRRGELSGAREVLLSLTTPQGTRATRSEAELLAAGPGAASVLRALRQARLVVDEGAGVTLAHESLLEQWGRLRAWVAASRSERQQAAALEAAAAAWQAAGQDETLLLRKGRLLSAEGLVKLAGGRLSAEARGFVGRSRQAERRGRVVAAASGALVAALFVGLGAQYLLEARRQRREIDEANAALTSALREAERQRTQAEANLALARANAGREEEARKEAQRLSGVVETDLRKLEERIRGASMAQLDQLRRELSEQRKGLAGPAPPASAWRPRLEGEPPP